MSISYIINIIKYNIIKYWDFWKNIEFLATLMSHPVQQLISQLLRK